MKDMIRSFLNLKVKIIMTKRNDCWFRRLQGMSATILQWFALDLEPPSYCLVGRATKGEMLFYNLLIPVSLRRTNAVMVVLKKSVNNMVLIG